jgi:transcriptional regulator with XRE-family HTH domain
MNYNLMIDEDVMKDIAEKVENLRISKHLKESEIEELAGISRKTLYNFRKGASSLSLLNFIGLLRALGEVERLQLLFSDSDANSFLRKHSKKVPKRVRDKQSSNNNFKWGDEK